MRPSKSVFDAILRADLLAFAEKAFHHLNPAAKYIYGWHLNVIAHFLEQCSTGLVRRLIINLPPRSLKSHLASIVLPAWLLGHRPTKQIICASYAQDLADKLAADCRNVMTSDWYRNLFPRTRLVAGRQSVHDFTTTENGFRLPNTLCDNRASRSSSLPTEWRLPGPPLLLSFAGALRTLAFNLLSRE